MTWSIPFRQLSPSPLYTYTGAVPLRMTLHVTGDVPSVGTKPEENPPSSGLHGLSRDVWITEWFWVC